MKIIFKNNLLLILIILIGFLLRIGNPTYASPILYAMSDEASNYMSALYMISQKTLITKAAVYPPLGAYIQIPFLILSFCVSILSGKFTNLSELQFFLITHEGYFLFVSRLISGVLGTLTIPIVYLIAKEIFPKNKKVILLSTLFFVLSFNHLHVSHFNRPWAGLVFFYALTILFSLKCITKKTNKFRNYLLVGVFAGLSFGFHYAGLFAFFVFLFTILPLSFSKTLKILRKQETLISSLIFLVLTVTFYLLIEKRASSDFFAPAIATYNNESLLILGWKLIKDISIFPLLKQILVIDPIITLFGIAALFLKQLWKNPTRGLSLFTVFYFLMASLFIHVSARYLMPLMIILSIYSAYFLLTILSKIQIMFIKSIFISIILVVLLINPILWNWLYFKEPTFIQIRKWINSNIPQKVSIASTSYRMVGYSPSIEAIKVVQKISPGYYSKLYQLLENTNIQYPDNVRNIYYFEQIINMNNPNNILEAAKKFEIKYVVDYYWNPSDKLINKLNTNNIRLVKHLTPIKKGYPSVPIANLTFHILDPSNNNFLFFIEKSGPYIDVLELKN